MALLIIETKMHSHVSVTKVGVNQKIGEKHGKYVRKIEAANIKIILTFMIKDLQISTTINNYLFKIYLTLQTK